MSSADSGDMEDIVMTLRDYSFVSWGTNGSVLEMHRLVQLATQTWLKANDKLQRSESIALHRLSSVFPVPAYQNWAICRALFPHVQRVSHHKPMITDRPTWEDLLERSASYIYTHGQASNAETFFVLVKKSREDRLGPEHAATLVCIDNLAKVYWETGRWPEAEEADSYALDARYKNLGRGHPSAQSNVQRLVAGLKRQGRASDAETLLEQVVKDVSTFAGEDSTDAMNMQWLLAETYLSHGNWAKAEQLMKMVVQNRISILGWDHQDTLAAMSQLSSSYRVWKRWPELEAHERQMLNIRIEKLGTEHTATLDCTTQVALACKSQGHRGEAETLEKQVIAGRTRTCGKSHKSTLTAMAELASTYRQQGRWAEAKTLLLDLLQVSQESLGDSNVITIHSKADLAEVCWKQGHWEEAEGHEVEVMNTRRSLLGDDHPATLASVTKLVAAYRAQGRQHKAIELQQQVAGAAMPLSHSQILF